MGLLPGEMQLSAECMFDDKAEDCPAKVSIDTKAGAEKENGRYAMDKRRVTR